jgi:hypothetical protein
MTNIKDNKTRGKAGLAGILGDYPPATVETLAGDDLLMKLYSILEPETLLDINTKIAPNQGDYAGEKLDTENSIGLVLRNKDYEPVSLICITPNSNNKPLITDTSPLCAFIIGRLDNDHELIAVDNLDDGIELASYFIADKITIIVSPNDWLFNATVKHFAQDTKVTVFTTLDHKNKLSKQLAGINVKLVIPTLGMLSHVENNVSYAEVLSYDDTQVIDLQSSGWADPEPLSTDSSKETPYPLDAWQGNMQEVVKAITYYAQAPMAMVGQTMLGVMAHLGQRFVDSPMGNSHNPASLIIITEGGSGSGKTETMKLVFKEVFDYEQAKYKEYLKLYNEHLASKKTEREIPPPTNPQTVFKNATIESLLDRFVSEEMHNASWSTDDGAQFFNGHTMTGQTAGSALADLTDLYSGGTVDRTRSQKSNYANPRSKAYNVRMTLMLMAQRVILKPALTNELLNQQGFIPRALFAFPDTMQGKRVYNDSKRSEQDPYADPALLEYWERCKQLLSPLAICDVRELLNQVSGDRKKIQWHDAQTEQFFADKRQEIENRQAKGGDLEFFTENASRMAENASRIASLVAYFDKKDTIDTDYIRRAFMLVEYSMSEFLRYQDASPQGKQNHSEKLSLWLIDKAKDKTPHKLNRTYISNNAPSPMRGSTKILQAELDKLESVGHIRQELEGRSKSVVLINPKLYL